LTADLISMYPGHEALWYHRRFVIHCLVTKFQGPNEFFSHSPHSEDTVGVEESVSLCSTKRTKLEGATVKKYHNYDELRFCDDLLNKCEEKSWEASLIHCHIRWLDRQSS